MGMGMGLNLVVVVAMVATNILSLYHLSSTHHQPPPSPPPVPDHLLHQLSTIRATINHLTRLRSTTTTSTSSSSSRPSAPPDLLLYAQLSPIAIACRDHPDLLRRYMNYTPFSLCPSDDPSLADSLILRGCHPLPRRRCFSPTSTPATSPSAISSALSASKSSLAPSLSPAQLLHIASSTSSPLRLVLDVGGGAGDFAALMRPHNVTVVTTTLNLGAPYNQAVAHRGLVPLHIPLQQRFPVFDGVLDLVRCGRAVNRWIPTLHLEFLLYDIDRVLRAGGFLWLDHFFCKAPDLDTVYSPLIGRLGYKKLKWTTAPKSDSKRGGEVYLTALLQKPFK